MEMEMEMVDFLLGCRELSKVCDSYSRYHVAIFSLYRTAITADQVEDINFGLAWHLIIF